MKSRDTPLLSICIPTNNRAEFLEKNLEKIAHITDPKLVEIVVADDFSTDKTPKVVKRFIKNYHQFRVIYKRFSKRVYFDRMVLNIVKLAHGKFCWLLGDDDLPSDGSISKIISIIRKYPQLSLIHLNYSRFDNLLKKITAKRMVGCITKDIIFPDYKEFYFRPVTDSYFDFLGTNIITMSTNIVHRRRWLAASQQIKPFIGYNFIHCFVIGTMILNYPNIYYIGTPEVQYLSNNHRIWPNNIWADYNRVLLGYLESIGYPKHEIFHMRKILSRFEKNETLTKDPLFKYLYSLAKPILSTYRYIRYSLFR